MTTPRSYGCATRKAGGPRLVGACAAGLLVILLTPGAGVMADTPTAAPVAPGPAAQLPAPPANGEMGFVFTAFWPAIYPGMDSCPDGWTNQVRDNFLTTLPPEEQARLRLPENEAELTKRWKAYGFGPNHTNICTNYDQFPDHPIQKMVQSKIAPGLNLDDAKGGNSSDSYVCPHEDFTSPTGEEGIDNQAYRAFGCERNWRSADGKDSDLAVGYKGILATGEFTIVMLLRGVHNLVNEDNVEVILASSFDKPIIDTQQNFIRDASYRVAPNPRWRNVLHGRIVDGVLTTNSKDILFTRPIGLGGPKGLKVEWDFGRARLRVAFRPDGTVEGLLGGYQPFLSFIQHQVFGGAGTVVVANMDCASDYNTMKKLADGGRDPVTGQCTRISSAWKVEAVPAFVFDQPEGGTKTAGAN